MSLPFQFNIRFLLKLLACTAVYCAVVMHFGVDVARVFAIIHAAWFASTQGWAWALSLNTRERSQRCLASTLGGISVSIITFIFASYVFAAVRMSR